LLLKNIISRPH